MTEAHDPHKDHECCHSGGDVPSGDDAKYDHVPADHSGTVYTCPMHPQVRELSNVSACISDLGLG